MTQDKEIPEISSDRSELKVLKELREQKECLYRMYEDLFRSYEAAVLGIEYGEIPYENIAEALMDDLVDISAEDYSFFALFERIRMFLQFNGENSHDQELFSFSKPRYRIHDGQETSGQIRTFGYAFGFIRTSLPNARESAEKQRIAIRSYCSSQKIEIKEEHVYIGPAKNTEDFLDYAFTKMIHTMCNILVVSDITRFGSNSAEISQRIRAFREKGITVYSAREGNITDYDLFPDPSIENIEE